MAMPGLPRLDGPFAASRLYGAEPLPVFFDILTLPFQLSNSLTGLPPIEIPVFGQVPPVVPGPTPVPTPTPTPIPIPDLFDTYLSQILTSYDIGQLNYAKELYEAEFRAGNLSYLDYLTLTNTYNLRHAALSPLAPAPTPIPTPTLPPPPAPAPVISAGIEGSFGVVGV